MPVSRIKSDENVSITEIEESVALILDPKEWGFRVRAVFRGDEPQNALLYVENEAGVPLYPPVPMQKKAAFRWWADVAVGPGRWRVRVTPVQGHGRAIEAFILR